MKNAFLFFLAAVMAVCSPKTGQCQVYSPNVPVYDTITPRLTLTCPTSALPCIGAEIFVDTAIINQISGLSYYVKFFAGNMSANTMIEVNSSTTINAGDSIRLTNNYHELQFVAPTGGGYFYYQIYAIGTPTQAGDSFYCTRDLWGYSRIIVDGCVNTRSDYWDAYGPMNCAVASPGGTSSLMPDNAYKVFPNPFSDVLNLHFETLQPLEITLRDLYSKVIYREHFVSDVSLHTDKLASGLYFYQVQGINGMVAAGKVAKK